MIDRGFYKEYVPELAVKAAYDRVPVGVQGRPARPRTNLNSLTRAYTISELVYACIEVKARAMVDPRLLVEQRSGDDWREIMGHPLRRVLMRPNSMMDEAAFWRAYVTSMDVCGVFYAEKERTTGNAVIGLHPLDPTKVVPLPNSDGTIDYEWRWQNEKVIIPHEDMLVRRNYHLTDPYNGLSPLAVAIGSTDADAAQTDYIRSFFNNAGVPSGILTTEQELHQEQADAIEQRWNAKFGCRTGSQHRTAVLGQGTSYERMGANLDELDSETVRGTTESRICMVFGVPPLIVYTYIGLTRSTYSNLREAWSGFWDATLSPMLKEARNWLLWDLLSEFESEDRIYSERVRLEWDISQVAALQEDVDATQQRARENFRVGAITLNELREAIGQQPDSNGDYYLRPLSLIPQMQDTDPLADEAANQQPAAEEDQAAAAQTSSRTPPHQVKTSRAIRNLLQRSTQRLERRIQRRLQRYLRDEYNSAAESGNALNLDDGAVVQRLMRSFYIQLFEQAYDDANSILEDAVTDLIVDFELDNPRIQDVLTNLLTAVSSITETTRTDVQNLIGQQASEGWSTEELARRIRELGVTQSRNRSELIARTETAAAYSQGSLLAYEDSGVVSKLEWLSFDPCPVCDSLEGAITDLGSNFDNGQGWTGKAPPVHPGCRCAIAPVIE